MEATLPAAAILSLAAASCELQRSNRHDRGVGIDRSCRNRYLIPTTIESGPARCSTRVSLNPASRNHPWQSAPV